MQTFAKHQHTVLPTSLTYRFAILDIRRKFLLSSRGLQSMCHQGRKAKIEATDTGLQGSQCFTSRLCKRTWPSAYSTMSQRLQTITEQYRELYLSTEAPETASLNLRTKPPADPLRTNHNGLSVSIARKLSSALSAKPPQTPAAGARGATCDLLDAHFCALDVNAVSMRSS